MGIFSNKGKLLLLALIDELFPTRNCVFEKEKNMKDPQMVILKILKFQTLYRKTLSYAQREMKT